MQISIIGLGFMKDDLWLNMADHGVSVADNYKNRGKVKAIILEPEAQPIANGGLEVSPPQYKSNYD
jgi:6-phosphogluconate dehydrogenase